MVNTNVRIHLLQMFLHQSPQEDIFHYSNSNLLDWIILVFDRSSLHCYYGPNSMVF